MGLKIDRRAKTVMTVVGIIILAIILIGIIKLAVWEHNYYKNKTSEERAPEQAVITSLGDAISPKESAISEEDYKKYQVSEGSPRYLEIPRLEVKARVIESNVNEHSLPLPSNIHDVSWYAGSGRPNTNSTMLFSGISAGATKPGVFANLDSLEKDNEIIIETGRGDRYTYLVKEISIVDKDNSASKLPEAQKRIDNKETVSLITARRKDESNDTFDAIVIVRAIRK